MSGRDEATDGCSEKTRRTLGDITKESSKLLNRTIKCDTEGLSKNQALGARESLKIIWKLSKVDFKV